MNNMSILIMVLVFGLILWRRTRAMHVPIKGSGWRMLIPLLILSAGFAQLANPDLHPTVTEEWAAVGLGLLLSLPMIMTTNFEVREDGHIYAKKSVAFIISLVGLLVFRLVLRSYIDGIDAMTLSYLFFLVAVCYIVPWRLASFIKFRKVMQARANA